MALKVFHRFALAAGCCLLASGCMRPWRPPPVGGPGPQTQPVQTQVAVAGPQSADYLRAFRVGRWVYQRRELTGDGLPVVDWYARHVTASRISEGTLLDRPFVSLAEYLPSDIEASQRGVQEPRPIVPLGKAFGVFFEVGEPMDPLPPPMLAGGPVVTTTPLRYFDRQGRLVARGMLTRTAIAEGYEDVTCPAGRFERCLRARVDLEVRFPLILTIDWNTYVWLSPEVGEVRRVQQFSGWFLIFWFGSAQELLLASYEVPPVPASADPPRQWGWGLVHLGGKLPRPRIEGLIVDLCASQPAP